MLTEKTIRVLVSILNRKSTDTFEQELKSNQAFQLLLTKAVNLPLLAEVEQFQADVIVLLRMDDSMPGIVSQIFDEYPGLLVIVFNQTSGNAVVCKQSISREEIQSESLADLLQLVSSREKCEYWGNSN